MTTTDAAAEARLCALSPRLRSPIILPMCEAVIGRVRSLLKSSEPLPHLTAARSRSQESPLHRGHPRPFS
jgi:hypothetical protein